MSNASVSISSTICEGVARSQTLGGVRVLEISVRTWFCMTLLGQWLFVAHIVGFYGPTALAGDFLAWNRQLMVGYVTGDRLGNVALGVHLAMAAILSFGGALQLIPQLRTAAPRFHRWSGRLYVLTAIIASITALYLTIARRGLAGGTLGLVATQVNGILILGFAGLAYQTARARDFMSHRRWAIRLFLAVTGVWFFRMEVFSWVLLNRGPVGFNPDTFEGPVLTVFGFAQTLLPLALFELYWRARAGTRPSLKRLAAGALAAATLITAIGTFSLGMSWMG